MGLLRFSPGKGGIHIALCSPDYFTLPLLSAHFFERFGNEAWLIWDEKRGLALERRKGEEPHLFAVHEEEKELETLLAARTSHEDPWEALWKNYHESVSNQSRANPRLQKQFMPKRYWKYLPEMEGAGTSR
jgi:probable DNA metabolism protein